jgi:divalent metal cation (Fe/Co/Zn/Cd) transporter
LVQLAIAASFAANLLLLVLKIWMAATTGSMAIIASAADSFLDLVSGLVLVATERAAHRNVDYFKYPEGKGRIEPVGVVIFATIMCLSSLIIFLQSLQVCGAV